MQNKVTNAREFAHQILQKAVIFTFGRSKIMANIWLENHFMLGTAYGYMQVRRKKGQNPQLYCP